jgi:uncharacterized protein involved in tolerance to divalent cations
MRTLKDFLELKGQHLEEQIQGELEVSKEIEFLELTESNPFMSVKDNKQSSHPMDPPAVLIMRRKSVRQFPNNQRVALYYVDKLDKYVTIPYTAMAWSGSVEEEMEYTTDIIEQLEKIVEQNYRGTVVYMDGSQSKVSVVVAESVLGLYENLNSDNKIKLKEMIAKSDTHMQQATDFVKNI